MAKVSFLLAVASPLAAFIGFLLVSVISALPSQLVSLGAVVTVVLYLSGLLSGMAAVVVGIVALVRSRRSQPRPARRGWAIAGIVVGIFATVLLVFPVGFLFLLGFSCAVNHMCV